MRAKVTIDSFILGDPWAICDRCGGQWRRSQMLVEWDNLRVCSECYDIRPPTMYTPDVYPEGLPFPDARPPQDQPDRLQDTTSIYALGITNGSMRLPNGQLAGPGALSPREITIDPAPKTVDTIQDDITIIVGSVPPPSVNS